MILSPRRTHLEGCGGSVGLRGAVREEVKHLLHQLRVVHRLVSASLHIVHQLPLLLRYLAFLFRSQNFLLFHAHHALLHTHEQNGDQLSIGNKP